MDTDTQEKPVIVNHQILRRLKSGLTTTSHVAKDADGKRVILTYLNYDKIIEQYRAIAHIDGVPTAELDSVAEPQAKQLLEEYKQAAIRAKGLGSDHVGKILDWGIDEKTGGLVIMQEYVPGVDIFYALDGLKPIHSICMFAQVAKGLDFIHRAGFLHLNIKPGRIQVNLEEDKPFVKITSPGFAVPKTGYAGNYYGSAPYMAPEVIFDERGKIDEMADMFSLGATIYYCITGRQPFEKRADAEGSRRKLKVIVEREKYIEPPSYSNKEVPEALDKIVLGLLEHDPDKRAYKTADSLLNAFHSQWPKESQVMPVEDTSTAFKRRRS